MDFKISGVCPARFFFGGGNDKCYAMECLNKLATKIIAKVYCDGYSNLSNAKAFSLHVTFMVSKTTKYSLCEFLGRTGEQPMRALTAKFW